MSSIDRPAHILKREKTLAIPRHMILFDTETTQTETDDGSVVHTLKLGWACYFRPACGRRGEVLEWQFFTDAATFWVWAFAHAQPKQRLWVIAHNVSFDFTIVSGWTFLRREGYKIKFFYSNGLTTIISVKESRRSLVLVDSLNWFPESLEQLGERVGIPKLKIDFDTADDSFLSTYCHRDVEILLATMKRFIGFLRGNRVSRLCYTIGSTAMAAYLQGCYDQEIYIHNNKEAIDLERQSYRGGRTECFYIGDLNYGPYTLLDFNSLYPYNMQLHSFPFKYDRCGYDISPDDLGTLLVDRSVVATVVLETNEPAFGIKRKRLIFPVGRFTATLCTPELKYALERNMILSVSHFVAYYQAQLFRRYVNKFYALRREFKSAGVDMYDHFCKILLNCLYGKFGQKAETWTKIGEAPNEPDRVEDIFDTAGGPRRKLRYLLGEVFELVSTGEAFNSFPAIASHVTAFGRMQLWNAMKIAGEGNYFYCDTDSLLVNNIGLDRLEAQIDPDVLGKLKVEYETQRMTIYGAKDYVTDTKSVSKGIRKDAERLEVGVYRQDRWASLQGLLRSNDVSTYTVQKVTKTLKREYLKGTVLSDGSVVPLILHELF